MKYVGNDIYKLILKLNKYFVIKRAVDIEFVMYKGKLTLFVVDFKKTLWDWDLGYFDYRFVNLAAI